MRLGVVLNQLLGHATHGLNLRQFIESRIDVDPVYMEVPTDPSMWTRWTGRDVMLQIYLDAMTGVLRNRKKIDSLFFHTVDAALFCPFLMRHIPSVVSLDATPIQYRNFSGYHAPLDRPLTAFERVKIAALKGSDLKRRLFRAVFHRARHTVTWSEWARRSVIEDYSVDPENVTCIPPGVDTSTFRPGLGPDDGVVRILFVGGDFTRKGGEFLLRWATDTHCANRWEMHLVTREVIDVPPNVRVHQAIRPNSDELLSLYQRSDIFAFPTLADCFGLSILEAMSSGLAVISTRLAAIPELVEDGRTGFLVNCGDYQGFSDALDRLVDSAELRTQFGTEARKVACAAFSAETNGNRLVDLLVRNFHSQSLQS